MAYFSNSSEFDHWQVDNCNKCRHRTTDEKVCPIEAVHFFHNYEQHGNKQVAEILGSLIPRAEGGLANEQCRMFSEGEPAPLVFINVEESDLEDYQHVARGILEDLAVDDTVRNVDAVVRRLKMFDEERET